MKEILLVGLGGFLGAVLRYGVSGWVQQSLARPGFPVGTLVVNGLGSFVLGLLFWLGEVRGVLGPGGRLFAGIGLLGGFTTFSTFSLETANLILEGNWSGGLLNILANLLVCVGGVFAARALVLVLWK